MLITLEGLDGSGKSTLAKALHEKLSVDNRWVYLTKEPGLETKLNSIVFNRPGVDIRSIVLNELSLTPFERELLFYVDASQHKRFIENQGPETTVISDRGLWSHLAYARATLKTRQMSYEEYRLCYDLIELNCAKPDVVIYLRGSLELMNERIAGKKKDLIESNGPTFFKYVEDTYDDLSFGNQQVILLNASNSTLHNVETVIEWLKNEKNNRATSS